MAFKASASIPSKDTIRVFLHTCLISHAFCVSLHLMSLALSAVKMPERCFCIALATSRRGRSFFSLSLMSLRCPTKSLGTGLFQSSTHSIFFKYIYIYTFLCLYSVYIYVHIYILCFFLDLVFLTFQQKFLDENCSSSMVRSSVIRV